MKPFEETKIKAIIPCAGLGTRVGMKPNQSKEMLLDENGYHLIDYSLMFCKINGFEPHIISRKEKTDLNEYITKKNYKLQIIKPKGEWQDTVLKSQKHWNQFNILILPDTRFYGDFNNLKRDKFDHDLYIYTHLVHDHRKWGMVDYDESGLIITEKPKKSKSIRAWGLIYFKKEAGKKLFKELKFGQATFDFKNFNFNGADSFKSILQNFKDLTRDKEILKWNK